MRVERTLDSWATRAVSVVWRAYDLQLTTYAVLLILIGLAMAYSTSVENGGAGLDPGGTFLRSLMWSGIGLLVFTLATAIDYRWLKTFAWPLYAVQLGLLVLTLAVGQGTGGSARWVSIAGVQFQFSELGKILMIIVLANFLAARQDRLGSIWTILGACALAIPPLGLVVLQPDLGTSLVFAAILGVTLFMSGASLRWLAVIGGIGLALLPLAWSELLRDYQKERLLAFLNPTPDIQGAGFQLYQAQIAVSGGGWFGTGLTNGTQNQLDLIPVQTTDFIFPILAEELGFVGAMVVFALFAVLLWRILIAGWRSQDPFGMIFASGLAAMVLFQFTVNVGMVIGLLPITGIPLPFISYGGASLISLLIGLGILQSINVRQGRADW
jgi:rod shape determining protein RodA